MMQRRNGDNRKTKKLLPRWKHLFGSRAPNDVCASTCTENSFLRTISMNPWISDESSWCICEDRSPQTGRNQLSLTHNKQAKFSTKAFREPLSKHLVYPVLLFISKVLIETTRVHQKLRIQKSRPKRQTRLTPSDFALTWCVSFMANPAMLALTKTKPLRYLPMMVRCLLLNLLQILAIRAVKSFITKSIHGAILQKPSHTQIARLYRPKHPHELLLMQSLMLERKYQSHYFPSRLYEPWIVFMPKHSTKLFLLNVPWLHHDRHSNNLPPAVVVVNKRRFILETWKWETMLLCLEIIPTVVPGLL